MLIILKTWSFITLYRHILLKLCLPHGLANYIQCQFHLYGQCHFKFSATVFVLQL